MKTSLLRSLKENARNLNFTLREMGNQRILSSRINKYYSLFIEKMVLNLEWNIGIMGKLWT